MSTRRRTRTIRTDYLARIEGEAAMYVRLEGHHVREVKLRIYDGSIRRSRRSAVRKMSHSRFK